MTEKGFASPDSSSEVCLEDFCYLSLASAGEGAGLGNASGVDEDVILEEFAWCGVSLPGRISPRGSAIEPRFGSHDNFVTARLRLVYLDR